MRRTRAEWHSLIDEQKNSGLTQTKFCKDKNINPKYFSIQKSKLRKPFTASASPFVKVKTLSKQNSAMTLIKGDVQLRMDTGADPVYVASIVKALL